MDKDFFGNYSSSPIEKVEIIVTRVIQDMFSQLGASWNIDRQAETGGLY